MSKPPFRFYLIAAFVAGGLTAWLPIQLGGIHGYQDFALVLMLAWLGLFAFGLALYGRRGWWLLLASPPALFWLYAFGGSLICARGCG